MDGNNILLGTFIALALLAVLNLPVISSWAKRKKAFNFYPTLIIIHAVFALVFLLGFIGQSKKISVALENIDIGETSIESIGSIIDEMKESDDYDASGALDAVVVQEEAAMENRASILKVLNGVLLLVLAIENLLFVLVFVSKYLSGTKRVRKYKSKKYSSVGASYGSFDQGPYGKSESTPLGYSNPQAFGDSLSYEYSEKIANTKMNSQNIEGREPLSYDQPLSYAQPEPVVSEQPAQAEYNQPEPVLGEPLSYVPPEAVVSETPVTYVQPEPVICDQQINQTQVIQPTPVTYIPPEPVVSEQPVVYDQQINQTQVIQQQAAYGQVAYDQQEEYGKTENLRKIPKNYNNNTY